MAAPILLRYVLLSSDGDPWHFETDPDPAIIVSDLQDGN